MNAAGGRIGAAPAAAAMDALAARLAQLRGLRREPGWAAGLLDLARAITLAEAGVVLAQGPGIGGDPGSQAPASGSREAGWTVLAPEDAGALPGQWGAAAEAALGGRGLVAMPVDGTSGRWCFAVALGPADPPQGGGPPRRGALVVEVTAAAPSDLALTRERIAFLGALSEAGAVEAVARAQMPQALAAAVAAALREDGDAAGRAAVGPAAHLHRAAALVASAVTGAQRAAILLRPGRRDGTLGLSDQMRLEPGAELPRRLSSLAEEAVERGTARLVPAAAPASPAERAFVAAFGARALLTVPAAGGEAAIILTFAADAEVPDAAATVLQPTADLLGALARARPPRRRVRRAWLFGGGVLALVAALAVLPRPAEVAAPLRAPAGALAERHRALRRHPRCLGGAAGRCRGRRGDAAGQAADAGGRARAGGCAGAGGE